MKILRAAERAAVPWKNGGGVTREVAAWPPGAGFEEFDWRVSIAEVRAAGPFSVFAGIDRTLAILEGRMVLNFSDREVTLDPHSAPFAFAGDAACFGTPVGGPVTDLNVMTRRGRCAAHVEAVANGAIAAGGKTLVVATAAARIGGEDLERFDAAIIDEACTLDGAAFAIRIA